MPTMINFDAGDRVRQAVQPFEGHVIDVQLEDGKPKYLVAYKDPGTGDQDERWFRDGEIELVERVKQDIKQD